MQSNLRNVCLEPLILRRKKKKGKKSVGRVRVDLRSLNAQGASCILASLSRLRPQGNSCSSVMQGLLPRRGDPALAHRGSSASPCPPHAPQPLSGWGDGEGGAAQPLAAAWRVPWPWVPCEQAGGMSPQPRTALRTPTPPPLPPPAAPSAALPNLLARQDREGCANGSGAASPRWQR